jgi:hypothetical protein
MFDNKDHLLNKINKDGRIIIITSKFKEVGLIKIFIIVMVIIMIIISEIIIIKIGTTRTIT